MPLFKDAQDVYDTLGQLFVELVADEELAPKFRKANTIVRYQYSEPDSAITVRLQEGQPGDVDFGDSEMEPEVTMTMAADTAHRFWLGEVNVTVALARGEIKAQGPVAKILTLVPLAKPVFPRYKAQLEEQGRVGPARMKAADWAGVVQELAAKRGVTYEPVGGLNPKGGPADALPGRHQPDQGRARAPASGAPRATPTSARRAACSRRPCCPNAVLAKAHMPDLGDGRADVQRRVGRGAASGSSSSPAGARSSSSRSISTGASWRRCPPTTTRWRCASCSAPASSIGRRRSGTRSTSGSPTASSTSSGGSASAPPTSTATRSTTRRGCSSGLRNEMEEHDVHTYQPGPWHAGLEPFPERKG